MVFIFLSCREEAHDNEEISRENSKHRRESQITTRYVELCFKATIIFQ